MPKVKSSPLDRKHLSKLQETLSQPTKSQPLWAGPSAPGPLGGVTQSMLGRWLVCRERFRLSHVEGLQPSAGFSKNLEYGNMWHVCEQEFALIGWNEASQKTLEEYCAKLMDKYPMSRDEVFKWYNVCKRQFPHYVRYWADRPDVAERTPLLQEQVFDVPYQLPSGRTVRLRGKWDSVDLIDQHSVQTESGAVVYPKGIWLQENKTKGDVDERLLQRQLTFDLQTMVYLIALKELPEGEGRGPGWEQWTKMVAGSKVPLLGVRYNVVRRPLSGGKGNIKQGEGTKGAKCPKCKGASSFFTAGPSKSSPPLCSPCLKCGGAGRVGGKPPESDEDYYGRLEQYIKDEPQHYFMRWTVPVYQADVDLFRRTCLDPILEQLCDWYDEITGKPCFALTQSLSANLYQTPLNFRFPYGIYNPLTEGTPTELDDYFATGSTVGLRKVTELFPELKGA